MPLAELGKLDAALVPEPGLRVVEFRVDRRRHRELHTRLRESVAAAAVLAGAASEARASVRRLRSAVPRK